ncbi:MFS transporter [Clostridium beijerinckii]|jgi:Na+/melibiose symporter and related transporters|uniref:MFS transporter n=2 Tax=Clostridium beijerinckii TaxID=1520 RepID=A0A1S8RHP1_CLOBE|nr:MFS transporter [Clostridium beijerinckii]ABR32639.1 oligogalacturonide transporter [Clostridium beijerinckii NCIMB 8052]AIU01314.1 oligogalacturonide transporter [Clostridium beijerinckii ATCC 35702]MBF7807681.1 MFS transporter [Clostridium beijerinckii]NOW88296.1 oligogalacturonide transporter [Clostridium beijerinckii]NRT26129.1 oligogalacturonide transporter [Clostridium beijerinckii]
MSKKDGKIRFINYFSYGMNDFIGAGAFALTSAWLLYFYTTFCGLTPIEASSIFALARIVDAVASPTMGFITDNFHKTALGRRFGRRKFFLLAAIPLIIVYSAIWVSGFSYLYYVGTYIAFEIVYTMVLIPYDTLAAEMTSDFKIRAKLTSARMYIAQFSAFLAAFIPGRLINTLGKESPQSFLIAGGIFTVIFIIVLILVYTFTWERSLEEIEILEGRHSKEKLSFGQNVMKIYIDLVTTLKIRTFRAHLGMYIGGYLAQDTFNAVFTYFIVFALFKGAVVASNLLALMYIFQIAGVGIATYCTLKLSPGGAFRVVSLIFLASIVGYLIVYGTIPDSLVALYVVSALAGLGRGGINFVPWNNYTFVPDVDEIVSADRREGVFAGFMSLLRKASQALAVFLVGVILQEFNFKSGSTSQPPEALTAMAVILIVAPAILLVYGIISSYKFKVSHESHEVLKKEIARLKDGGLKEDVDAETRTTVEELTGLNYENVWGNNKVGYRNWRRYKENQKA